MNSATSIPVRARTEKAMAECQRSLARVPRNIEIISNVRGSVTVDCYEALDECGGAIIEVYEDPCDSSQSPLVSVIRRRIWYRTPTGGLFMTSIPDSAISMILDLYDGVKGAAALRECARRIIEEWLLLYFLERYATAEITTRDPLRRNGGKNLGVRFPAKAATRETIAVKASIFSVPHEEQD